MNHFLKITNMKISKIFFSFLTLLLIGISQVSAQTPDPYVNGATVNPAPIPLSDIGNEQIVSVSFNFGNASPTAIPLNSNNVINVSLSKLNLFQTFSTAANIVTTGGDYFTFSFDFNTKTLTATQKEVIPALGGEQITLRKLYASGASDSTNPQNGLNVNVSFLRTYNSELGNDNTSSFTFTRVSGSPLPIRLLSFTGTKQENSVQLNWKTSSEQNSSYYNVQFSEDGNTWNSLGKVSAAGNSNVEKNYLLIHKSPVNGANYYRLILYDKDGKYTFSNVVIINFKISGITINSVYPNPFVNEVKIDVSSDRHETVQVVLSDNTGRICKTQTFTIQNGVNHISINDLSKLSAGMYVLQIKTTYAVLKFKLKK
jgi:hypothetical protein